MVGTDILERWLGTQAWSNGYSYRTICKRAPVLQHGPVQQQQHTIKLSYFQGWGVGGWGSVLHSVIYLHMSPCWFAAYNTTPPRFLKLKRGPLKTGPARPAARGRALAAAAVAASWPPFLFCRNSSRGWAEGGCSTAARVWLCSPRSIWK